MAKSVSLTERILRTSNDRGVILIRLTIGLIVYESPRRYRRFGYIILLFQGIYSLVYQQIFKKNVFKEWRRMEKF
jgi:hypothetical protein